MRKLNYLFVVILLCSHALAAESWDIINKSMTSATPWDADGGATYNKAWKSSQKGEGIAITQETDFRQCWLRIRQQVMMSFCLPVQL